MVHTLAVNIHTVPSIISVLSTNVANPKGGLQLKGETIANHLTLPHNNREILNTTIDNIDYVYIVYIIYDTTWQRIAPGRKTILATS